MSLSLRSAAVSRALLVVVTSVASLTYTDVVFGQSELDRFKRALEFRQQNAGCESIPYDDLRRQCTDTDYVQGEFCGTDTRGPKRSCNAVGRSKNDPDAKKSAQAMEEFARGYRRELETRLEINRKCSAAREGILKIFEAAINRAHAETAAEIRPIASQLASYWQAGNNSHTTARQEARNDVTRCEQRLSNSDY